MACAFSPDGARIVSGSSDTSLRLWDASSGRCIRTLEGHSGGVTTCAFSPDGARIVSGGYDKSLRLWDANSGQCIRTLEGHSDIVTACAFSPDGARIVSGGYDTSLRLWDADMGACLRIHAISRAGHAVWDPRDSTLIEAHGDAWRWLKWRLPGIDGAERLLPLEAVGDVCAP